MTPLPRLAVDSEELGKVLGCSGRFLRDQCPDIPRVRRGRLVLFPLTAVAAWLEQNARPDADVALPVSDDTSL
jgi:hypothetical protein